MKKIFLIFGACFSIVVLPYSLIFSFEAPKNINLGMQSAGISFPDPVSLVFWGMAMFCLARLGRKRFLIS
jgi:hypothetical protein